MSGLDRAVQIRGLVGHTAGQPKYPLRRNEYTDEWIDPPSIATAAGPRWGRNKLVGASTESRIPPGRRPQARSM
jgi:hypothetical protein